jgi:Transposase DNA-binding/Transposase Tn5 dimerisation domain
MIGWIEDELRTADLRDARLNDRFRVLLQRLSQKPTLSLPAACNGWAETQAAYRFFDNDKVDDQRLLRPHFEATMERIRRRPVVLIPQDTTEFELTRAQERVGGPLGDEDHWGVHTHVALAVTPQRLALGLVSSRTWARDPATFRLRKQKQGKPIGHKESSRWLEGYRRACEVAAGAPQTRVVSLSDSEGDIYECFAAAAAGDGPRADWIVRACQDRCVRDGEGTAEHKLFATAAAWAVLGTLSIEVGARPARSRDGGRRRQARGARTARLTVRAGPVVLQTPERLGRAAPHTPVHAVLVREAKPPAGEAAIEWLLLTSLPAATFEQARDTIHYYTCRWEAEIYFRVLKSGCMVERLQLETTARFTNCLAVYQIVAWRVLFALRLGRQCPELPCDVVFSEAEWRAVYQVMRRQPATAAPSLGDMVTWVAALGGHLNRKGDGPPGPQTMWIGMQRARDFALTWTAIKNPDPGRETCV